MKNLSQPAAAAAAAGQASNEHVPKQTRGIETSSYQDRFQAVRRPGHATKHNRGQVLADLVRVQLKTQREHERDANPDRPRTLAEAVAPVGTCPDMCPEFERVERIVQKDVWGPETVSTCATCTLARLQGD